MTLRIPPEKKSEEIRLRAEGFDVVSDQQHQFGIDWRDVHGIAAYKRDLFSVDEICVGFNDGDPENARFVNESMAGYKELIKEIERRYPDHDANWWSKVAWPAFSACWTVIWGDFPERAECPACHKDISGVTADACPHCGGRLETIVCPDCRGRAGLRPPLLYAWRSATIVAVIAAIVGPLFWNLSYSMLSVANALVGLGAGLAMFIMSQFNRRAPISCGVCEDTGWIDPRGRAMRMAGGFRGRCEKCGYSLARLTGTVCPECGTAFRVN